MKKLLIVMAAFVFVLGLSTQGIAQDNGNGDDGVTSTTTKTKTVNITETVSVTKTIDISVTPVIDADKAAQAHVTKTDSNTANKVLEPLPEQQVGAAQEEPQFGVVNTDTIDLGAFDGATGIGEVNQGSGSLLNQGNATTIAASLSLADEFAGAEEYLDRDGGAVLGAEAAVEQTNTGNVISGGEQDVQIEDPDNPGEFITVTEHLGASADHRNLIDMSFQGAIGLFDVNQSAGNTNNQNNANSIAFADHGVCAISDADLSMVNTGNIAPYDLYLSSNSITNNAAMGSCGIFKINQSSGNMNNQANMVTVSVGLDFGFGMVPELSGM